jgi:deoxyribonuclease-4
MTATLDALVATVGPGRLDLVHANDSLDACGSRRDRHTNVGEGLIGSGPCGAAPFAELMTHPAVAGVPVVVETPSQRDGTPYGGHVRDIGLLVSLRDRAVAA